MSAGVRAREDLGRDEASEQAPQRHFRRKRDAAERDKRSQPPAKVELLRVVHGGKIAVNAPEVTVNCIARMVCIVMVFVLMRIQDIIGLDAVRDM